MVRQSIKPIVQAIDRLEHAVKKADAELVLNCMHTVLHVVLELIAYYKVGLPAGYRIYAFQALPPQLFLTHHPMLVQGQEAYCSCLRAPAACCAESQLRDCASFVHTEYAWARCGCCLSYAFILKRACLQGCPKHCIRFVQTQSLFCHHCGF